MSYKKIIYFLKNKFNNIVIKIKKFSNSKNIFNKKKDITKKGFVILIVGVIFIISILAFIGYNIGRNSLSLDTTLNSFEDSLKNNNETELRKMILDDDKKINRDFVKPIIDYYEDNTLKIESTIDQLKGTGESDDFTLVKKDYIFFSKYYLKIKKYNVTINSNFEDGEFSLQTKDGNDKNYAYKKIKSGETIRDVYPGVYKIYGRLQSDYGDIESSKDITVMSDKIEDVDFNAVNICVKSDFKDADIFIGDSDTNIKISDNKKIGPLISDGSLNVHIEQDSPFGTLKSDSKDITDVPTINLNVNIEGKDLDNDIDETLHKFYSSVFEALNKESKDSINNATDGVKNKIFSILSEKYFILKNKYDITDIEIDKDKSELRFDGTDYKGTIVVKVNYDVSKKLFGLNKTENHKNFFTRIIYKNDEWVIEDIDNFEL